MNHTAFRRSVILAFAFSLLNAQQPLAPPLRNWAAPLYWAPQPGEIEHQRAARQDASALPQAASIFTAPGPMTFIALTPCRLMTRGSARASRGHLVLRHYRPRERPGSSADGR